jgi:urease accessory protein
MLVLDTTHDVDATEELETLVVDDDQRRRSRFRTTTDEGREVGVVPDGEDPLRTGDVLGTAAEPIAVVELEPREAAVVDLAGVDPTTDALLAMVERGHALGNRHRELAVRGSEILIPVTDGRQRLTDELRPLPDGADLRFEAVDPGLFDDAGPPEHSHGEADGHGHSHSHDDGHDHTHEGAGTHTHAGGSGDGPRTIDAGEGGDSA